MAGRRRSKATRASPAAKWWRVTSSRLTAAAKPGEILVSTPNDSPRGVADRMECAAADDLKVKGFPEPIRAWSGLSDRAGGRGRGPACVRLHDQEPRQFSATLNGCVDSYRDQTIHIRGEGGIGKTRPRRGVSPRCYGD
jgi:hypothetical protein